MTASTYDLAISAVLKHEGGFVNHPKDPGGATNRGITQRTLSAFRGTTASIADVKVLSLVEAKAIYRKNYANVIRFNDLPAGLDYAVLDYAVNSGPSRAAKALQRQLGVNVDGVIGDVTVAAARAACAKDELAFIVRYWSDRHAWLKTLSTYKTFGKGWTSRITTGRDLALSIARKDPEFGVGIVAMISEGTGSAKAHEADEKLTATPLAKPAGIVSAGVSLDVAQQAVEKVATLPQGVSWALDAVVTVALVAGVAIGVWQLVKLAREKRQDKRSDAMATA
jgi:lysozyme family protein